MENKEFHISLKCLFCASELKGNTEKEYKSGDILTCQECGESNDYDSLREVAIEEGKAIAVNHAKGEISKMLKDIFKK
jgi:hypothetical protein